MNDAARENPYDEADEVQQEEDIQNMQISIDQAQHQVRLADALDRLQQSPDFKILVMQDYLKDQAARLSHLLSDHTMQSKKQRKALIKEMEAIGNFLTYLRTTAQRGQMAREAIRVNEAELRAIAESAEAETH